MADGGVSKCGRKAALSTFFTVTFIAFTLSVIALISPSWQYVYLENGRTEHQHGLWLDCKRDFSFDYGRTREYYETLYRRDLQGSPFDIFFLPPLQCVYKFDYYIDPEDLYDHNHDENRIQNDAYQHLFLGWKIAALSGCGSAVVFSASALLFAVLAFCHRTFICASTVLVTISAILSSIGVTVFYAWANYQDNKVIKEDGDTTYEQILGWAFYCQIVTTIMHWLASMLGCCVTSVSFSKTRAKLVKIEVVEGNDERQLLSDGRSSSQPFKRSFSAIYRVDSQSLRQWERDYMRNARERQQRSQESPFKRTASMPNFSKKQAKLAERKLADRSSREVFSSTSNITETTQAGSINTLERNQARRPPSAVPLPARTSQPFALPTLPKLRSALKTPQQSKKSVNIDDSDITYECLPCDVSAGVSSLLGGRPAPLNRTYDPVYEQIGQENYLEPNSVRLRSNLALNMDQDKKALLPTQPLPGSSQSIPITHQKTTVINDVVKPLSSSVNHVHGEGGTQKEPAGSLNRTTEEMRKIESHRRFATRKEPVIPMTKPSSSSKFDKPPLTIRDFGISPRPKNGYCDIETTFDGDGPPSVSSTNKIKYTELEKKEDAHKPPLSTPLKYISVGGSSVEGPSKPAQRPDLSNDERMPSPPQYVDRPTTSSNNDSYDVLPLARAGIAINTFGDRSNQRTITNLTFRPQTKTGASEVFERPDSITGETSSTVSSIPRKPPLPLQQMMHRKLLNAMPDEVDRSVGSSTLVENDVLRDTDSYIRDAEIRLNLFMNDVHKDETTV
ncbi:hypothetical protein V3C99_008102 [Haemonchus contortus]